MDFSATAMPVLTVSIASLVISWFAALILGQLPAWSFQFLGGYLVYRTRIYAYFMLLLDAYPPFAWAAPEYPVQIWLRPDKLNRLAVLFRIILVIPAAIVADVTMAGWAVLSFFIWLIMLFMGRVPEPVFGATAAALRYGFRTQAYFSMLSPAYPKRLFGDLGYLGQPQSSTRPLLLTSGARTLLIVYIVLGALAELGNSASAQQQQHNQPVYHASAVSSSYPGNLGNTVAGR